MVMPIFILLTNAFNRAVLSCDAASEAAVLLKGIWQSDPHPYWRLALKLMLHDDKIGPRGELTSLSCDLSGTSHSQLSHIWAAKVCHSAPFLAGAARQMGKPEVVSEHVIKVFGKYRLHRREKDIDYDGSSKITSIDRHKEDVRNARYVDNHPKKEPQTLWPWVSWFLTDAANLDDLNKKATQPALDAGVGTPLRLVSSRCHKSNLI